MPVGYSVYQDKQSFIHQELDPRSKFIWVMTMFVLSLCFNHPLPLFLLLIINIFLGLWAKLRLQDFLPIIGLGIGMTAISIIMWPLYIHEGITVFRIFGTDFTLNGLLYGFAMGLRVALMMAASSLWIMTTSPQEITLGFVRMGLPYKAGMAISMIIRFVPFLMAEIITIIEARKARGASFVKGSIVKRIRNSVAIVIPLFSRAFMVAQQLALAMDARGFGARPDRSSIVLIGLNGIDRALIFSCLIILFISIALRLLGIGVIVHNYL